MRARPPAATLPARRLQAELGQVPWVARQAREKRRSGRRQVPPRTPKSNAGGAAEDTRDWCRDAVPNGWFLLEVRSIMQAQEEAQRLLQLRRRNFIEGALGSDPWLVVYSTERREDGNGGYFCALIPEGSFAHSMANGSWDLHADDGRPGLSSWKDDVTYHRFGGSDAVEPFVLVREFHGVKPNYIEICEEFRLFHNLYHDRRNDKYIRINNNGDEEDVAVVTHGEVRVKTRAVRQFPRCAKAPLWQSTSTLSSCRKRASPSSPFRTRTDKSR